MPLHHIEHYLVLAKDLDATRKFYVDVLGMIDGERPPFDFAGHWLYLGDQACVHVAQAGKNPGQRRYLGESAAASGTGSIDHIAFRATGLAEMINRLDSLGIEARRRTVPDQGLKQLFIRDPNGVTIELNYPASEAEA